MSEVKNNDLALINFREKISQVFRKWSEAKSTRRLYGSQAVQVKQTLEGLFRVLGEVLAITTKPVSFIKRKQDLIVLSDELQVEGSSLQPITVFEYVLGFKEVLDRFNIESVTFSLDLKKEELEEFFEILNQPAKSLGEQGNLKEQLTKKGVININVDQLEFKLLKEGFDVISAEEKEKAELEKKAGVKIFKSSWQDYLDGNLEKDNFQKEHTDVIKASQDNPKELLKILKRLTSRQEKVEDFLANLEQKLFDLGFPEEAVENIKKSLLKPKKVQIGEDELARLRKIAGEFNKTLDERVDNSLKEVNKIKKKLSDEKERSDAILRQISQGVVVVDKEGKILGFNPVAQKVLGISSHELQGKTLKDIVKDHHMVSMVSEWDKESEENTPKNVQIISQNQQTQDAIRESSLVIENENGSSIGVVSSLQSVVDRQELEKRKNDILEVLGHDLRAPLAAVKHNFSLIVDNEKTKGQLDEYQIKFTNLCKKSIDKMEKLIYKILDARQLETGKVVLKKEDVDTRKLLEDCVYSLVPWAKDKKINLDVKVEPVPMLSVDPERIYQVLTNLISNALKFTPENGSIDVKAKVVENDSGKFVEISVKDSGIGIKEEDLKRVFNKYEQVSLQQPAGASGLGLGLSICSSIVELHGGKIWAESKFGQGSTFIFQLPILDKERGEYGQ